MRAQTVVTVERYRVVPTEGRAAYLDSHRALPAEWQIVCYADGVDWESAGWHLDDDGSLQGQVGSLVTRFSAALQARLRLDPADTSELDVTAILRVRATEIVAEQAAETARAERAAAECAAKAAAETARVAPFVAELESLTDDDILDPDGTLRRVGSPTLAAVLHYRLTPASPNYDVGVRVAVIGVRAAVNQRLDALDLLQRQRHEAAKKRLENEGIDQIETWLAERGTPSQQARHEAGRLDVQEVLDAERDRVFGPELGERYQPLRADDVPHGEDCVDPRSKFTSDEYDGPLTEDQFARLEAIEAAAPKGARVVVRKHKGWCPNDTRYRDEGAVERYGARVSLQWGGAELHQEYALGD